jgi:hypothetical protein
LANICLRLDGQSLPPVTGDAGAEINAIIARHGRRTLHKDDEALLLSIDSQVFETNVHFPTNGNLTRRLLSLQSGLSLRIVESQSGGNCADGDGAGSLEAEHMRTEMG